MELARLLLKLEDTPLGSIVRILHLHNFAERFLLPRTLRFRINGTPVDFTVYRLKLYLARAGVPPDEELYLEGYLSELFLESVVESSVVYDIGADHGYYTLAAALKVGEGGAVYAFEPNPTNARAIRTNVDQNDVGAQVHIEQMALMDDDSPDTIDLDHGRVVDARGSSIAKTRSLDDVVDGLAVPDLIKIDVEGAEFRVLNGSRETLAAHHPELIIEVHEWKLPEFDNSVEQLYELLEELNYSVTRIQNPWDEPEIESSFSQDAIGTTTTYYLHAVCR